MKTLYIKNARRTFSAARDNHGVVHIEAANDVAALYGLGYLHATDRPTQILFARVIASGRSSERIADKPELVETDRFFRRVGLYRNLHREVGTLDDQSFELMQGYCEGVNDALASSLRSLPMWATGFQPEPWDPPSVLLVGNLLNFGGLAVSQQQNERLLIELVQAGVDGDKLKELFRPALDELDLELLRKIQISSRLSDEAIEVLTDLPRLAGSNAWAVSPSRSASGHALLACDPHLEVNRLPSVWYEAVLHAGKDWVMGATLPGCPFFAVGRNKQLSWGVTYFKGDTSDFFVEDCRNHRGQWQYRRGDQWHDFQVREEAIVRKGGQTERMTVFSSPQGTLDVDLSQVHPEKGGYFLSTLWTGDHGGGAATMMTWLRLGQQKNVKDAMHLVRSCPQPTLCWVFADEEGNIGKQTNGWFPRRRDRHSGLLPVPAWDEKNHWQGWLPFDLLPCEYNPERGFVATANESQQLSSGSDLVSQPVPSYRKRRIDERLGEIPSATIEDMQALQYDVTSLQARDLLPMFLSHLPEGPVKTKLAVWDFTYDPNSLEATLFTRLYRNVLLQIFGEGSGSIGWRRMLYLSSRAGFSMMMVTAIDRLLTQDTSLWWEGRDKGELIRAAAVSLAEQPDQAWAITNAFSFTNRYFEGRFVGRALGFHTNELPMRGCHATPFQGHLLRVARRETTFAPSYHFVTDMGTQVAHTNLPGGASESWLSRWYKNDVSNWLEGTYKELRSQPNRT